MENGNIFLGLYLLNRCAQSRMVTCTFDMMFTAYDEMIDALEETMNKKKFFLALLVTVLTFCAVAGGVGVANFLYGSNLSGEIAGQLDKPTGEKANILVMGLDEGKTRADTIMIVSVNPKENAVRLLSVPRDTQVTVAGKTIKINSTMAYQRREELMIEKLREITGMPIHYYAEIDFEGFKKVVDILGGVDYNVPYNMNYDDPVQNLHIHLNAGMQHLDGQAAHDFVRFRHNNGGSAPGEYAMGDQGRISAQQNFLKELVRQKLQPQYITKMPELMREIYQYVTTNFTIADALKYVGMLETINADTLQTFVLPGEAKYEHSLWYYIHDAEETRELVHTEFGYVDGVSVTLPPKPSPSPSASPESGGN